jgi:tetratricopeptide (TPR) repeat protein
MARHQDPARRYASAAQFAEDIQRYLDGQPVRAQKDSFTYRAGKFVRRNKVGVAAAAVALLTLMGGIIATVWQARRAEANRARAEKRFGDVRGLSNALLNDIAPKIERLEGSTGARQALVTQSLKYLDSLAGESAGDFVLQAELAAAYEKVGVLQGDSRKPSLSDFRGAIASLEKAQQLRRRLLEINPNDAENSRLLADNLRLLAIRRMTQSDVDGGLRDDKEALQIYENLVSEQPGSLELRRAFLETQVEDATRYINLSRYAEAIPLLQQAAAKIEALRRTNLDDTEIERIQANCLASLALALSWESRQPEAEAEMARAVTNAESLVVRFPNDTNLKQELWKIYEMAASIYEEIDDARAFELCEKSQRVVEEIIAADRANTQARHNLSKSFSRLGISASNLGKPVEAIGYLERAMAIVLELQEKDPLNRGYDRDMCALHIRTGVTRFKQREFPAALAAFQKSAELYEKQLADDASNTITLRDSAIAYRHAGVVHKELAKTANQEIRQHHLAAEKENYQRALNALLKAQAQKALPESSRVLIERCRKDIEELEKSR